jgi:23S rRNA (guanosine2251-2'-O)-methyltransferase
VEGRRAVLELLRAGRRRVRDVWMVEDQGDAGVLHEIGDRARRKGVRIQRVGRARLEAEARTSAPQGVLAHAEPLDPTDLDELCRASTAPFLLALDHVTDPQNLGAVLRAAEGAGASGVVLPRHRAAHISPAVTKAAAGAVEYLPIALVAGLPAALARLRERGVWIVGLDEHGDGSLFELGLASEPLALVLGAEGRGLARLVRQRCDVLVRIPMAGRVASLNVASAATLAAYEVGRRRLLVE